MKGAIMKLGQMMSFVSDDIPEEYRTALASLQHAAPAMDFPLLRDVAERELKIMKRIDCRQAAIEGCTTRAGTVVAQLVG